MTSSSTIAIEKFSFILNDVNVFGHLMLMEKSCWIWISFNELNALGPLVVSMPFSYDNSPAVSII